MLANLNFSFTDDEGQGSSKNSIAPQSGRPWRRATIRWVVSIASAATLTASVLDQSGALAAGNMLQNPSLETGSGTTPSCWLLGGYGTNKYASAHTTDAHAGSYAENLNITSLTSGARKLLSAFDSGTCAPAAAVGTAYSVTARYKGTAAPRFWAYYRRSSGSRGFWKESRPGAYPASSSWIQKSWTPPALPSGAARISVRRGLDGTVGSLTMDDFSLTNARDARAPSVPAGLSATPGDGQVALSWDASTDKVGVTGYDVYRDSAKIATVSGTSYTDTALTDGITYSYTADAFDAAGNASAQSAAVSATPTAPSTSGGGSFLESFDELPVGSLWGGPSYYNVTHANGWVSDCNNSYIYSEADLSISTSPVGSTNGHGSCQRWYTSATFPGATQTVTADFKATGWDSNAPSNGSWAGFKFFMSRDTADNSGSNYTVEPVIYDNTIHIQKKCYGIDDTSNPLAVSYSNGGTWYLLAQKNNMPLSSGWHELKGTVKDNPDGSATITLYRDGSALLSATDKPGLTGCPVLTNGHVGWRSDFMEYEIDNFTASSS